MASGKDSGDPHPGPLECSRATGDPGSEAPLKDARQDEGRPPPGPMAQRRMVLRGQQLEPRWRILGRRRLAREWSEREERRRKRQRKRKPLAEGQGEAADKRRRMGSPAEGGYTQEGRNGSLGDRDLSSPGWTPGSLKDLGVWLWWLLLRDQEGLEQFFTRVPEGGKEFLRGITQSLRVSRQRRALFPLPHFWHESIVKSVENCSLVSEILELPTCETLSVWCWSELALLFCNHLSEGTCQTSETSVTTPQRRMCEEIERSVRRLLEDDCNILWNDKQIEEDLAKRNLSYTGEEVSIPNKLTIAQVVPGLPPEGHGGRIRAEDWVSGKCKFYLENPGECLLEDRGQELPRLQARVHVEETEKASLGKLLVERGICRWIRERDVLRFRGQKVLNGLFGVEKNKSLEDGRKVLRLIMNLIPSNSIHRVITGRVHELPHITRWCSIFLEEGEVLQVCQSDISSAFYLFSIPEDWTSHLCFNFSLSGKEAGKTGEDESETFFLGSAVLPMGWSSAVGVMQFIAEEVLYRNGMNATAQIRRSNPLPIWMTDVLQEAESTGQRWWHVYLDNYASGEKVRGQEPVAGEWQHIVETAWESAGIVSSKEKAVRNAETAQELGAYIGGKGRWIGASAERLLKIIKTTLWLVRLPHIPKKLLQVVLGRWVFVMQFRRPGISRFSSVWDYIGGKIGGVKAENQVREELVTCCMGALLFHTFLACKIDDSITCNDASGKGGAIAIAESLTPAGNSFLQGQDERFRPIKVPVVIVSLFNGIGGVFRCLDLAGVRVVGGISCDKHKPANRVTSRRWPWVTLTEDIRDLTSEVLEKLFEEMGDFQEIHIWIGFPCVDLSSAKAFRSNLSGRHSSLVYEAKRVVEDLKVLFPDKVVKFIVENVASMDVSARDAISELWGCVPIKVDPSGQVPMFRPRFCWTDLELPEEIKGLIINKSGYIELQTWENWPSSDAWLDEACWQNDPEVIYPTCMKAIRRNIPPPRPAGLDRCDEWCQRRWQEDWYKVPPYQYKDQYLIGDPKLNRMRLLSITERERLMGFGTDHTAVCYSASKAKSQRQEYEDERLSLVGDSFNCCSFMIFAAIATYKWTGACDLAKMQARLGLPPGFSSALDCECPLQNGIQYGNFDTTDRNVRNFNAHLAARTNHTGSDVKLISGELMNPRQVARESVQSSWWVWRHIFKVAWQHEEHINPLECRAIFLSLMWKARQKKLHGRKFFHLTDSYVCQSILSKGRTSSKKMTPIVKKVNALLLACGTQLCISHVDSSDNPTDKGSREVEDR